MQYFVFVVVTLLLVACSATPEVAQIAPTEPPIVLTAAAVLTVAAAPTPTLAVTATLEPTATVEPTMTAISLAYVELEPLLVESGDLPSGYRAGKVVIDDELGDLPRPANRATQQINYTDELVGAVDVFLYADRADVLDAYKQIAASAQELDTAPVDVGEQSVAGQRSGVFETSDQHTALVFQRCHGVIGITLFIDSDNDAASALSTLLHYAKRLDNRLQAVACNQ